MVALYRMTVTIKPRWLAAGVLAIGLAEELSTLAGFAVGGNAQALYYVGKRYAGGDGVPQDYGKATEYLRQAADRGCILAENDLGAFYAKGLGVVYAGFRTGN